MRCETVSRGLPKLVDGGELDVLRQHHLEQCLSCQAELARYKRLRRELRSLVGSGAPASEQELDQVRQALDAYEIEADRRRSLAGRTAACLGGLAAAGAVVVASRRGRIAVAS